MQLEIDQQSYDKKKVHWRLTNRKEKSSQNANHNSTIKTTRGQERKVKKQKHFGYDFSFFILKYIIYLS